MTYNVAVKTFICDAPARAYLKCIKGHTAKDSCERYQIKGTWKGRVVFNEQESYPPRTDRAFNQLAYDGHQTRLSPLVGAGIACIKSFVLDYMHLVCLGVVKRMLVFLKQGPNICRISPRQRAEISENLMNIMGCMPSDFARQPRSLSELDRYKATELLQFLLYTGVVVLKDVLDQEVYEHFLELSVAMSMLLESDDDKREYNLPYARQLLDHFVNCCEHFYGETFTVYNVHNIKHISDDVAKFQCSLNVISAFEFENHLQSLKKLVKNSTNPIVQVARHSHEIENAPSERIPRKQRKVRIEATNKDGCFLLDRKEVVYGIVREKMGNGIYCVDTVKMTDMSNFFTTPCNSKKIDIAFISARNMQEKSREKMLQHKDLKRKAVHLPYRDGYVMFPLLHGIETLR